jgi:hypothetical protein
MALARGAPPAVPQVPTRVLEGTCNDTTGSDEPLREKAAALPSFEVTPENRGSQPKDRDCKELDLQGLR